MSFAVGFEVAVQYAHQTTARGGRRSAPCRGSGRRTQPAPPENGALRDPDEAQISPGPTPPSPFLRTNVVNKFTSMRAQDGSWCRYVSPMAPHLTAGTGAEPWGGTACPPGLAGCGLWYCVAGARPIAHQWSGGVESADRPGVLCASPLAMVLPWAAAASEDPRIDGTTRWQGKSSIHSYFKSSIIGLRCAAVSGFSTRLADATRQ